MFENTNMPDVAIVSGSIIGERYRVEDTVGTGAAVQYVRARDVGRGDAPAIVHRFRPPSAPQSAEWSHASAWFLEHAGQIQSLSHGSLNQPTAAWCDMSADGALYLAAEFVPGNTLDQERAEAEDTLSWRLVVDIGIALARLLGYLHTQPLQPLLGVLRPQRIVLDARNGKPVLVAFGIAEQLDASIGDRPGFIPFEQWIGRPDQRSDIYALGMILGSLLTNRDPDAVFTQSRRSGLDVQRSMRATAGALSTPLPGVPPALGELLTRATAFTADDRFASAAELEQALRAVRGPDVEAVSTMVAGPEEAPVWKRAGLTREAYFALPSRERNALVLAALKQNPNPPD